MVSRGDGGSVSRSETAQDRCISRLAPQFIYVCTAMHGTGRTNIPTLAEGNQAHPYSASIDRRIELDTRPFTMCDILRGIAVGRVHLFVLFLWLEMCGLGRS